MRIMFYVRGYESLGVEYLTSYLMERGHEVGLLFDPGLDDNCYYNIPALRFLNKWPKLVQKAIDFKPDVVGFSVPTNIYSHAIRFATELKKHVDVPYIFGAYHPTVLSEFVLQNDCVDYVIRGEGEIPMGMFLDAMERGESPDSTPSFCYIRDGKYYENPLAPVVEDLDSLPFPHRDLFFEEGAFSTLLHMISSRGCPHRCTYCMNNFLKNDFYKQLPKRPKAFRQRSPRNVVDEIKECLEKYPIEHIFFCDEVFVTGGKWLDEFVEIYRAEVPDIKFSFSYHHKFIDDDVAKKLAYAGGTFAQGAIETADPRIRKEILKRNESDEDILRAISAFKKHGIKTSTSAIFGIPTEVPESRWRTIELIEQAETDMTNSYLMYPFPGTEMVDIAKETGYLSEKKWKEVKEGKSSYHQHSMFEHPDIANAETMAKLLPLYLWTPKALRGPVRWLMGKEFPRLAHWVYILSAPLVYSGWAFEWIVNLCRVTWRKLMAKDEGKHLSK